ncbi:MAG: hypothetical protein FWG49_04935, partial [Leptospirales bacterium]|nr:hypothetical protein [Leptospirales bacterium]
EGGSLVEINNDKKSYSNGIAIQYHCGVSFIREYDWRGNPLFGLNLLLDCSFGSDIKTLGLGVEVHFLWIFKIAAGSTYIQSENSIFKSGYANSPFSGKFLGLQDKKSATLDFFQVGITIPLSNKFDLFVLWSNSKDKGYPESDLSITSLRTGVSLKF